MQSPVGLYDPFNPCESNRTIILEGCAEVKGNIYRTFLAKTYGAPVPLCFVSEPAENATSPKKYYLSVDKAKISITPGIIIEPKVNSTSPIKTSVNVILISTKDGRNCYLRFSNGEQFAEWRSVLSKALVEVLCHEALVPLYTGRLSTIRLKNCIYTCSTLIEETDNPSVLQIKRIVTIKEDVTTAMEVLQTNPRGLTKAEMQSILRAAKSEPCLQSDPDILFLTHLATLQGCGLSNVSVLCKGLELYNKNTDHPIMSWRAANDQPSSFAAVESVKVNLTSKFSLHTSKTPNSSPVAAASPVAATPFAASSSFPLNQVSSVVSPLRDHVHFVTEATSNDGTSQVAVVLDGVSIAKIKRKAGMNRLVYRKQNSPVKAARTPVKRTSELSPMAERTAAVSFTSPQGSGTTATGSAVKSVLSSGVKAGGSASKNGRRIHFNHVASTSDGTPVAVKCEFSPKTPTSARKAASVSGVLSNTRSLTPMTDKQSKAIKDLQIQNIVENYLLMMESVVEDVKNGNVGLDSTKTPAKPSQAVDTRTSHRTTENKPKSPKDKRNKGGNGKTPKSPGKSVPVFDENVAPATANNTNNVSASGGGGRPALTNLSASKANSRAPQSTEDVTKADIDKPNVGSKIKNAHNAIAKVSVSELTIRGTEEFAYVEKDHEMVGCYKKMNKVLELLKPVDDEPPEVRFKSIMKTFNLSFDAIKGTPGKSTPGRAAAEASAAAAATVSKAAAALIVCDESAAFMENLRKRRNSVTQKVVPKTDTEPILKIASDIQLESEPSVSHAQSSLKSPASVVTTLSNRFKEGIQRILTPVKSSRKNTARSNSSTSGSRVSVQEGRQPVVTTPKEEVVVSSEYCSPQVDLSFDNIMEDLNAEGVQDVEQENDCGVEVVETLVLDFDSEFDHDDEPEDYEAEEQEAAEVIELQSDSTKATINRLAILLLTVYLVAGICIVALTFKGYQRTHSLLTSRPSLNLDKSQPILLLPPPPASYSDEIHLPQLSPEYLYLSKGELMNRLTTGRFDENLLMHYFDNTMYYESDATEYSDSFDFSQQWSSSLGTMTVKIVPRKSSLMGDLKEVGMTAWNGFKNDLIEEVESM